MKALLLLLLATLASGRAIKVTQTNTLLPSGEEEIDVVKVVIDQIQDQYFEGDTCSLVTFFGFEGKDHFGPKFCTGIVKTKTASPTYNCLSWQILAKSTQK